MLTVVLIRRETPLDQQAIFAVHNAAFATSDGTDAYEATLVDELRAAGDAIAALSFVAELDGQVVGHVLGSHARIGEHPTLALGPLGVLPSQQRIGVGSALVHTVLGASDALDYSAAVLLGDHRYYRRFGFELAEPLGVIAPDPTWAPHFQIRTLSSWTGQTRGAFRYAPAFDAS
jgi:putative acetyltransferase